MLRSLDHRIDALEQQVGEPRYFVAYPEEGRYVLPGGRVVDVDTFAMAVERTRGAVVVRVEYEELC
jgi:hypothetical protein